MGKLTLVVTLIIAAGCADGSIGAPSRGRAFDPVIGSPDPTSPNAHVSDAGALLHDPPEGGGAGSGSQDDAALPDVMSGGTAGVRVDEVSSTSVALSWSASPAAESVRVYVSPEPAGNGEEPLPGQLQLAELAPGTTSYRVEGLAPAVDVFLHVELLAQDDVVAAGNVHARTLGGPLAKLDTELLSVHLYAPDVLMLVFDNERVHSFTTANDWWDLGDDQLYDYTGAALQAGQWSVERADSTPIAVEAVFRDSLPMASNYQELGYSKNTNDHLLDVQHSIFLKLEEPIGEREVLRIAHVAPPRDALIGERDAALDVLLPYSDRYLETPVIQLNQVGYNPRATRRYAYVSGWMGDGGALPLDSFGAQAAALSEPAEPLLPRTELVQLALTPRASDDEDSGGEVRQIDLASLPASDTARYRIRIPGVGVSWQTQVNETAVLKAYYVASRGLFLNRWGRDLQPEYTDWCTRPPDHTTVFTNDKYPTDAEEWRQESAAWSESDPQTNPRTLQGGHHDAGDFDIRPGHYLAAVQLLRAYELNASAFVDEQLDLPESGNGIPDFLDEILWNLAGWEQLQESDGGVRAGVESHRHPWGVYYADQDPLPFFTYARDTQLTARVAGLFAQAAFHVRPFDAQRAAGLQKRAIDAYDFAYQGGLRADDTATGGGMMYASGELYRLTGDPLYKQHYEAGWNARDNGGGSGGADRLEGLWPYPLTNEASFLGDFALGYLQASGATPSYVDQMRRRLDAMAAQAIAAVDDNHAHRNGRPVGASPNWGKGTSVGEYVWRLYYQLQIGELSAAERQAALDAISLSADYVLGANPLGMVWITGLGSRFPLDPLHSDSRAFIIDKGMRAMPGLAIYGPTASLSTGAAYETANRVIYPTSSDWASRPLLRRYAGASNYVTMNEFTLGESQASQAQLLAINLAGTALLPPNTWRPGEADHPNPLPTGVASGSR